MKFLLPAVVIVCAFTACKTNKQTARSTTCFKGRLEVKGLCSNYTIKLMEGDLDTARIAASWTNEATGKAYTNVFALGSPCSFPSTLNEGDEFYFSLADSEQACNVCMAYYPKPPKALSIKVLDKPCN